VIIDDLDIVSITLAPYETKSPLVINPNAMLAAPVAFQCLQAISRWNTQVGQPPGPVQVQQLSPGNAFNGAKTWNYPVVEKQRCIGAPEGPDHTL
jgi:hypothetical protein